MRETLTVSQYCLTSHQCRARAPPSQSASRLRRRSTRVVRHERPGLESGRATAAHARHIDSASLPVRISWSPAARECQDGQDHGAPFERERDLEFRPELLLSIGYATTQKRTPRRSRARDPEENGSTRSKKQEPKKRDVPSSGPQRRPFFSVFLSGQSEMSRVPRRSRSVEFRESFGCNGQKRLSRVL